MRPAHLFFSPLPFSSPKMSGVYDRPQVDYIPSFLGLECSPTSVEFVEVCAAVILTPWGYIITRGYTYPPTVDICRSLTDTLADMFLTDMQDSVLVSIPGSLRGCEDNPNIFHFTLGQFLGDKVTTAVASGDHYGLVPNNTASYLVIKQASSSRHQFWSGSYRSRDIYWLISSGHRTRSSISA